MTPVLLPECSRSTTGRFRASSGRVPGMKGKEGKGSTYTSANPVVVVVDFYPAAESLYRARRAAA